jgi:dienelactone hydrolase
MRTLTLCALLVVLLPSWALAQLDIRAAANQAPDLKFPGAPQKLGSFSSLEMAIYKPDGAGPFPALVLVHTCGGLRPEIGDWAKNALARGYVAFVIDSLGPRGVKSVCIPPSPVNIWRGVKDAFQALEHLQRVDLVDQSRVGLMGSARRAFAFLANPASPAP